jgi:hypothetical protein
MDSIKTAKSISDNVFIFIPIVISLILVIIVLELTIGLISNLDPMFQYSLALRFGSMGVILAFITLLFYPLRKIGIHFQKSSQLFKSKFYKSLSTVLALLHPVLGLLTFLLLSLHGFMFLGIFYNFSFDIVVTMGLVSLLFLTVLLISGSFLKKKLSDKKIRLFHFTIALMFILFFILHRFFA